ncbi:MAG: hypothetical protein AB7E32_06565 [Desulfovibrio sp.]
MHIRPKNVFKAICYGHECSVEADGGPDSRSGRAGLVDISATSARLLLLADADTSGVPPLRQGDNVSLHPQFLEPTGYETIPTRVAHVQGPDVVLRFKAKLPFTCARLVALTRR